MRADLFVGGVGCLSGLPFCAPPVWLLLFGMVTVYRGLLDLSTIVDIVSTYNIIHCI